VKIVHVTETLVAGVLAAVAALAARQSALGHDVTVVYTRKPNVPPPHELDRRLPPAVRRLETRYRGRPASVLDLGRAVNQLTDDGIDVLHLHSTFAGIAGRVAPRLRRRVPVIAYSPHGWAFLRGKSSAFSNRAALALERVLARRCNGLILVSYSEAQISRRRLGSTTSHVLTNGIPVDGLPVGKGSGRTRPVIVTTGRIMEQKGPDRFADVARAFNDRADFVWIGDGTQEERELWLGDAPVQVTGWLPHDEVIARLVAADVFLFPTRWEGMPIALMEAQAIGLPAVATDIVGNRDVIVDGETGTLCDPAELIAALSELVDDAEVRRRMRENAVRIQRERLSDTSLGERSLAIYTELGGSRRGASARQPGRRRATTRAS
jgi:glycosyltransferase involved in cell wall biosynthesis